MPALIDLTETAILTAVRGLLLEVLEDGTDCIRAQVNRVPQPISADFVVMTPLRRERLATNIVADLDIIITGAITETTLTVETIANGTLSPGQMIFAVTVEPGTRIVAQLDGETGGIGTYSITPEQIVEPVRMYAGLHNMLQKTEITLQLDVHGPNSASNAQIISTVARDGWVCEALAYSGIQPLYAAEARQVAFINAESQFEDRYVVELCLQGNPTVGVAQQFADEVEIELHNVCNRWLRPFIIGVTPIGQGVLV